MTIRSAALAAAFALAASATPALAGDLPPLPPLPDETYDEPYYGDQVPHMGYSYDERARWLEDCRARAYRSSDGRTEGAVIGGVLGAVAGGVAGNAIDDGGTTGTLVGAGVGAVAGAAIGSAIGEDADRRPADQCEDYLLRYEQGYAAQGYGYGYGPHGPAGYGAYPAYPGVVWARIPVGCKCGCQPRTRVERIVERVPAPPPPRPAPRPRPTKIERVAPPPGKLLPVK